MGDLLLRKLMLCRERIEKIRSALPALPEQILNDERNQAFVAFNLFLLIQDAMDLAAHLISERGPVPNGNRWKPWPGLASSAPNVRPPCRAWLRSATASPIPMATWTW
jgi:hypothetical protein